MLKTVTKLFGYVKAPKTTYLLNNPKKGPKNLLALRGAKSLARTKGAAIAAGVAAGAAAIPLVLMAKDKLQG